MSHLQDILNTLTAHAANVLKPGAAIDLNYDSLVRAAVAAIAAQQDDHCSGSEQLPAEGGSWKQCLWDCLHSGAPPSTFACSFPLAPSLPSPQVAVDGVGQLALPLCPEQAATLRAVAEQAPYGKGMATVVDTDVRSALQVDASKVAIGSSWEAVLQGTILPAVAEALSLTGPAAGSISAELYKLLLYERGGHFAAHRDTEKAPRMFATLVVQLPCAEGHEGGKFVVRHGGQEVAVDTTRAAASTVQCTAFFADCEHQLLPITMGRRLVLAYNLCWTGQGSAPHAPDGLQSAELAAAVRAWEQELAAGGRQERLALLLEHQYTDAHLSFTNLKGNDQRLVQLAAACPLLECHLALLTRTVRGGTESPGHDRYHDRYRQNCYKRRRYCGDDDDDEDEEDEEDEEEDYGGGGDGCHVMTEVYEDETKTEWRALDGSRVAFRDVNPDTEFFHPKGDGLYEGQPDDEDYEEYMGNEGPTLEQVYYRAVLVLWPCSRSLALARATGVDAVLSLLAVRLKVCKGSTGNVSAARQQAQEVLKAAIGFFEKPPQVDYYFGYRATSSRALVNVLQLLLDAHAAGLPGAEEAALRLLSAPCWVQALGPGNTDAAAALSKLLAAFESESIRNGVVQLAQSLAAGQSQLQACATLLAALATLPELQQRVALAAADSLLGASDLVFAAHPPASVLAMSDLLLDGPDLAGSHYGRFVAVCMKRQDCLLLLLQLLATPKVKSQPGVWQQVALAAIDALLGRGDTVFAQQQPALLLSMSDLLLSNPALAASQYQRFIAACVQRTDSQVLLQQLLRTAAVQAQPGVREQVALAAADALLGPDGHLFAQQQPAELRVMSDLLLSSPGLAASHYGRFAAACLRRQDCQALLQQLLKSPAVQAAASLPAVQQLVQARQKCLEAQATAAPTWSWRMPLASFPANPQVQDFLRGPKMAFVVQGCFNTLPQARKWGQSYFGSGLEGVCTATYSAKAREGGRGKEAHCRIIKTRDWFDKQMQQHQKLLAELQEVSAMHRLAS